MSLSSQPECVAARRAVETDDIEDKDLDLDDVADVKRALNGKVKNLMEKFNIEPRKSKTGLQLSAGYKWHRDYERIGYLT